MGEEPKKGFWSRFFGGKSSCCCSLKIEEVNDDSPKVGESSNAAGGAAGDGGRAPRKRSGRCCGGTLGVMVLAALLPVAATAASSNPAPAVEAGAAVATAPAVGVDALMSSPEKYQGTIRVRGVVSTVFPKEQRLGLLDAIYLNCCATPCGSLQLLPVRWTGAMPATRNLVIATGEIQRTGAKMEFVATNIETVTVAGGAGK